MGPLPYAVAAASAASDSPTVAAGADEAMPMTVSWATPIALGSRRAAGAGFPRSPWRVGRSSGFLSCWPGGAPDAPRRCEGLPRSLPGHPRDHNDRFRHRGYVPASNVREFPGGSRFPKVAIPHRGGRGTIQAIRDFDAMKGDRLQSGAPTGGRRRPAGSRLLPGRPDCSRAKVVSFACRRCLVTRDSGGISPPHRHHTDHSWPGTRAAVVTHVRQVARDSCTSWPGAICIGATGTSPTRCG